MIKLISLVTLFLVFCDSNAGIIKKTYRCKYCGVKHSRQNSVNRASVRDFLWKKRVLITFKCSPELQKYNFPISQDINPGTFGMIEGKFGTFFLPETYNLNFGNNIVVSDLPFGFARIVDAKLSLPYDYKIEISNDIYQETGNSGNSTNFVERLIVIDKNEQIVFCDTSCYVINKKNGKWVFPPNDSASELYRILPKLFRYWWEYEKTYDDTYDEEMQKDTWKFLCSICKKSECNGDCPQQQKIVYDAIEKFNKKLKQLYLEKTDK